MQVDFYSDIGCVWCYIGMHRLKWALERFPARDQVTVMHRPFQLDPTLSVKPQPQREFVAGLFGPTQGKQVIERVIQITGNDGIPYDPDRSRSANTLSAHRLLRLAQQEYGLDTQAALKARLYGVRFFEGGSVADLDLIAGLAEQVGMDRARVDAYLASDEGTREVRDEVDAARALGISSVPTFIFDGKWSLNGAQETDVFLKMLQRTVNGPGLIAVAESGPTC